MLGRKKELWFYRKVRVPLDFGLQWTVEVTNAQFHVVKAGNSLCFQLNVATISRSNAQVLEGLVASLRTPRVPLEGTRGDGANIIFC